METSKYIYCRQETILNREHAFPQSLLQKGIARGSTDNYYMENHQWKNRTALISFW